MSTPSTSSNLSPSKKGNTLTDDDIATVRREHAAWVHEWDRVQDAGPWDLQAALGRYYRWDAAVTLYDDMDPAHRTARSLDEYRSIWEPVFNGIDSARHCIAEGPDVELSGDLASSWLVFVAELRPRNGPVVFIRSTNALVWRRFAEGWRIVRDHTSSIPIAQDAAEKAFERYPRENEPM